MPNDLCSTDNLAEQVKNGTGDFEAGSRPAEVPNAPRRSDPIQQVVPRVEKAVGERKTESEAKENAQMVILRVLLESREAMPLVALSKASELPRQTVRKSLVNLKGLGMVEVDQDGQWAITIEGEKWYQEVGHKTRDWVRSFCEGELEVEDYQVTLGASIPVTFHIPKLKDGSFILWKCLPNCGKCCRKLDRLPLTAGDIERLKRRFHYESFQEFTAKECNVAQSGKEVYNLLLEGAGFTLKRQIDEREDDGGKTTATCRFLNESSGCGIYQDRPTACRMWPFTAFGLDASLHIAYVPRNAAICPGFYLSKDVDRVRRTFTEEAETLATAYLKKDRP